MPDYLNPAIFYDNLTADQREALLDHLATDPELAASFNHWKQVRSGVAKKLETLLPDRHLLVLYALDESPRQGLLTPPEKEAVRKARPTIEKAIHAYPALADVVRSIQAECHTFENHWKQHFDEEYTIRRQDRRPLPSRNRRTPVQRWVWRSVVSLVCLFFAVMSIRYYLNKRDLVTIETSREDVRLIHFADGSLVRLMESSVLQYAPTPESNTFRRYARVSGRAVFLINPDSQGFVVETPTARATVLSTVFAVQAADTLSEFVLVNGRLAIASKRAPDQPVFLDPGHQSRVYASALPTTPVTVDLAEALAWTELFIFEATPIVSVVEQLSRHYDTTIVVAAILESERVTGTFDSGLTVDEILQTIALAIEAEVTQSEDGSYHLVPVAL